MSEIDFARFNLSFGIYEVDFDI